MRFFDCSAVWTTDNLINDEDGIFLTGLEKTINEMKTAFLSEICRLNQSRNITFQQIQMSFNVLMKF